MFWWADYYIPHSFEILSGGIHGMVFGSGLDITGLTVPAEQLQLIALTMGKRSKRQPLNATRWPIYVFDSVDNTKLLQ